MKQQLCQARNEQEKKKKERSSIFQVTKLRFLSCKTSLSFIYFFFFLLSDKSTFRLYLLYWIQTVAYSYTKMYECKNRLYRQGTLSYPNNSYSCQYNCFYSSVNVKYFIYTYNLTPAKKKKEREKRSVSQADWVNILDAFFRFESSWKALVFRKS